MACLPAADADSVALQVLAPMNTQQEMNMGIMETTLSHLMTTHEQTKHLHRLVQINPEVHWLPRFL
jgi:hypothetical protein